MRAAKRRADALEEKLLRPKATVAKGGGGGQEGGGMSVVVPLGQAAVETGKSRVHKRNVSMIATTNLEQMRRVTGLVASRRPFRTQRRCLQLRHLF